MSESWNETTLGDILRLEYGKALPASQRDGSGYPVLGSNGVVGLHSSPLVVGPGIVVGRKGTAGSVTWSEDNFFPIDTTYYVHLRHADSVDLRFTYLLLVHASLPTICAQTGVPGLNRDRAYKIPVRLPPLAEQRRIVDLIGTIDAHIANLRAGANTAQVLHRLLVSQLLEPAQGSAAHTAQVTLGSIATFVNGYPFKPSELNGRGLQVLRIRQLLDPTARIDRSDVAVPTKNLITNGDLIFSWSGTLASRIWTRGPAVLNQHLFKVEPREGTWLPWLHHLLEHSIDELSKKTHGSTMKHITKRNLEAHLVHVPPIDIQVRDAATLQASERHAKAIIDELNALESFRTRILESLLSRELELPAAYDVLKDTGVA